MKTLKWRQTTAHYRCGCPLQVDYNSPEMRAEVLRQVSERWCSLHAPEEVTAQRKRDINRMYADLAPEVGWRCERRCWQTVPYQEGLSSREIHGEILCEFHRVEKAARAQLALLEVA